MTKVIHFFKKTSWFLQGTIVLTFFLISLPITAQEQLIIKGKVFDATSNNTLVGATIISKEEGAAESGVLTDGNGGFSIKVKSLPVSLKIHYVGYQEQDVDVYEISEPITIILQEIVNKLNEVVIVGYGSQKRKELTGSIASIPTTSIALPSISFDNILEGSVAGLNITQSSGQPGASSSIRIRGGSSINGGNEPLYVIDGFILYNDNTSTRTGAGNIDGGLNPLSFINPNDIASVEVLKDVSATSIYGSRGANGVIIITTKKGTKGSTSISYQISGGYQYVNKKLDLLNAKQWASLYNDLRANDGLTGFTDNQISQLGNGADWQSAALRTGTTLNHQLSFSGGDGKSRYLISGYYNKQKGIVKNTDIQNYGARFNYDRDLYKNLKVGLNGAVSSITQNSLSNLSSYNSSGRVSGPFDYAIRESPLVPVYSADGSFNYANPYENTDFRLGSFTVNPISDIANTLATTNYKTFLGSFYVSYAILPNLIAKVNAGSNVSQAKQDYFAPSTSADGLIPQGKAAIGNKGVNNYSTDFTLNYKIDINKIHVFDVLAGYTAQNTEVVSSTASSSGFDSEALGVYSINSGNSLARPTADYTKSVLLSYLGRVNYSLLERYNLTATFRADGSSRFSSGNRWGIFPSVGFSWNINQEPFFKSNVISNLKLRISTGKVGNQEIGDYKFLALYAPTLYSFGGQLDNAYQPSNLGNDKLKWETTTENNAGIDLGLIKDKVNLFIDGYIRNTSDLLVNIPVSYTTGLSSQLANVGSVSNKGLEATLNADIINEGKFKWSVTANITKNVNKVTSLGSNTEYFIPVFDQTVNGLATLADIKPLIVKVGEPLGSFYGYQFNGVVQTGDDLSKVPTPSWTNQPVQAGDPKYKDQDGNGKITESDKVVLGSAQPKFTYGFSTNLTYENFDLSILFQGSQGNELYNALRQNLETTSESYNSAAIVADRWTTSNPSTSVPRAIQTSHIVLDSRYIEDASFLKLRNVTLGYTIPFKVSKIKSLKLRLFASGQNLLTITKYKGFDPEASRYGGNETSGLYQGIDLGVYPSSKSYLFGLNLTF